MKLHKAKLLWYFTAHENATMLLTVVFSKLSLSFIAQDVVREGGGGLTVKMKQYQSRPFLCFGFGSWQHGSVLREVPCFYRSSGSPATVLCDTPAIQCLKQWSTLNWLPRDARILIG